MLLISLPAAVQKDGLLADSILRLRCSNHRDNQFQEIWIHLAAPALGFALALQHGGPVIQLLTPLLRTPHRFEPEIRPHESAEFRQLRDNLLLLHLLVN